MCVSQTLNQRPHLSHTFKAEMAEGQLQHKASFTRFADLHGFITDTVLSVATLVTPSGHLSSPFLDRRNILDIFSTNQVSEYVFPMT